MWLSEGQFVNLVNMLSDWLSFLAVPCHAAICDHGDGHLASNKFAAMLKCCELPTCVSELPVKIILPPSAILLWHYHYTSLSLGPQKRLL
jgi:hypothetical protein